MCEPILVDRPFDPRDYDIVERGMRIAQITMSNQLYRAPGHQVFLLRALAGLDGYAQGLGHRSQLASHLSGDRRRRVRRQGGRMKRWYAMSAIGRDRPGIVADLAELIYESDCNLEDSRMTILGSEFAVLLLLSAKDEEAERRLASGAKRLEWETRLTVFIRPLEAPPPAAGDPPPGVPLECVVTGVDRAGIVARVARTVADHGANITDLHSELRPEPESGTPIYTLRLRLVLPPGATRRRCARRSSESRPSSAST